MYTILLNFGLHGRGATHKGGSGGSDTTHSYIAIPTFGFNRSVEGENGSAGAALPAWDGPGPACCVFSAHPLEIEPVRLPLRALAAALLQRCKAHGSVTVVYGRSGLGGLLGAEEEVGRFWMLRSDSGCVVAAENSHPVLSLELTVRVSGHNIGCSRGRGDSGRGFETADVVPPSHSQLLRLDTQIVDEGGYSYQIQTQYRAAPGPHGGSSKPLVEEHGLHAPFPSFS